MDSDPYARRRSLGGGVSRRLSKKRWFTVKVGAVGVYGWNFGEFDVEGRRQSRLVRNSIETLQRN